MNIYRKYCPNVYVAQCEQQHQKGDVIEVTTRHGKENECIVHNFVGVVKTPDGLRYCYSITRADGFNSQERAKARAERLNGWAASAISRGEEWREKSNEGRDFLALGEPIKVGHHSEKRHRALIDRNWERMGKAVAEYNKAEEYKGRVAYWAELATKIDLSMPESIDFFSAQLAEAIEYHKGLKDGSIPRSHSYSLAYAAKNVKELRGKYETAVKLWGDSDSNQNTQQ